MGTGKSHCAHPRDSPKEALEEVSTSIEITKHGSEGLLDLGFEYRLVPCQDHTAADRRSSETLYSSNNLCFECATRIFHVESNIMVTEANRKEYIPDGRVFDEACLCSQDIAVEWLKRDFSLRSIALYNHETEEAVHALVSADYPENQQILLIIAGKGRSRAGILSVKHLMVSGFEKGSAVHSVLQAAKRGLAVVLLDPNARGVENGFDTVTRSLQQLALKGQRVYVHAHSAGGGFLVRHLLNDHDLLDQIDAVIFTDSTHNIQWTRENEALLAFLSSKSCLYIKNNAERPSDTFSNHKNKPLGTPAAVTVHWQRRFGSIATVYAGTTDHSYMCWSARNLIWEFFDSWIADKAA